MTASKQPDLFVTLAGDVPLRDDKEAMSIPLVSLSKGKRTKPIEWASADGDRYVRVSADATHGMATIWDWDIVIWSASQINAAVEEDRPVARVLRFHPYDLLKAIGRGVSGKHYREMEEALRRLKGTNVETNIRIGSRRRKTMFGLLDNWQHETDATTGRSRWMEITLSRWVYDGAVQQDVLAIPKDYFKLTSGIARFLYRLARRHAGKQATGWRFTMKDLHLRSGSTQPLNQFARDVRRVVAGQGVPEYRLDLIAGQRGDEMLAMIRDPARVAPPQRRDLAKIDLPPGACSGDRHVGSPTGSHVGSPTKARGITHRKRL